jgi:uncharacterized membrane protein YdjX (TVP38/TMEM64 family)
MKRSRTLPELLSAARSRRILACGLAGLALLGAIALLGEDLSRHIATIEAWVESLGPLGIAVFVAIYVLATSLLFPESALSVMAGALFGLGKGLAVVIVGSLLAATTQYLLSRHLLRERIQRIVAQRPTFAAIQRAVRSNELRLQLLLRLTPLNPASGSYVLSAAGVRFGGFLAATLGTIPHLLLEVYIGYAGKHLAHIAGRTAEANYLHEAAIIGGLATTVIAIGVISKITHNALSRAIREAPIDAADSSR